MNILRHDDLRSALDGLTLPFLRIYGALDGLVPRRIAPQLDARWPHSQSVVIAKAAHAPFISHPEAFCQQVQQFIHAAT